MSNYPPAKDYEIMYARYFNKRSIHELIKHVPNIKGGMFADLCCGGGHLATELALMGADDVFAVDSSKKMIKWALNKDFMWGRSSVAIHAVHVTVSKFLSRNSINLDAAFCRQAINYWFNESTAKKLAKLLKDGGHFVFNTFNEEPPEGISYNPYAYDGRAYLEVNQRIGNMIHHTQHCEGFPPHQTKFRWISREEYHGILESHFRTVKEIVDGKTSIYVCEK